jgi:hypothetical protein
MTGHLIKTFLYQQIMKLAFEVDDADRQYWIRACLGSFQAFWQTDYPPCLNLSSPLALPVSEFDMQCKITVNALDDFSVTIHSIAHRSEELILRHEPHSSTQQNFLTPYSFDAAQCSTARARAEYTKEKLGKVIDYMLLHPFVCIHIKGPNNPQNNIRLGGGITNAIQYLFHLRYQLCPEEIR